jgi:signal transduction histidine kinase
MKRLTLLTKFSLTSLALFVVIGLLLGWGLTTHFEQQAVDQHRQEVTDLVPPVIGPYLTSEVLARGAFTDTYKRIEGALSSIGGSGLVRIKIWNPQGMIAYSDQPDLVGQSFPISPELQESLDGTSTAEITPLDKAENIEERGYGQLLEVYAPVYASGGGEIIGAFEGYYDVEDVRERISFTNQYLWLSIGTGFLFLYVSLFTIVRNASQRLLRQSHENAMLLMDSERKAARLELVNELARSINESSLDLDAVFRTALRGIDRIVPHNGASITLLDERTGAPLNSIFSEAPEVKDVSVTGRDIDLKMTLLGDADTFLCVDTRQAEAPTLRSLAEKGALSALLVSIGLGERRLGLLDITGAFPNAFDDEDTAILKGVADQLAVAIENSHLIKATAETRALREANRLKDEFVSMVSHELRTPLASIKGYARTLLAVDGQWDEETKQEFVSIISDESDKLADLVENLLEMSRIEAGRVPISPEPILLPRFCKDIVERLAKHHPDMQFKCGMDEKLALAEADPRRVEQVLVNLLQNAAKYSGGTLVTVDGHYNGGVEVTLSVADDGVGIAPEHLPHLFDKFYRVENDRGGGASGTGLGLAIARKLVDAQGGRIWVESKPGKGTTFYFTLPALIVGSEDGIDPAIPAKNGRASSGSLPVAG